MYVLSLPPINFSDGDKISRATSRTDTVVGDEEICRIIGDTPTRTTPVLSPGMGVDRNQSVSSRQSGKCNQLQK